MKTLAGWMMAATMALAAAAGQTPAPGTGTASNAACPCGRTECKCQGNCGGRMSAGGPQAQGQRQGRMAMRAGRMGAGGGMCMRANAPANPAQPKVEKK